jgi:hypothetical protein
VGLKLDRVEYEQRKRDLRMKCDQQYDAELARKSDKHTEGFRCGGK